MTSSAMLISQPRLPRWAPVLVAAMALAAAGLPALFAGWDVVAWLAASVVVYLVAMGVIDPAKVVRSALQNAASVAGLMLTTEALVAEKPKDEKPAAGGHSHGGMGDF